MARFHRFLLALLLVCAGVGAASAAGSSPEFRVATTYRGVADVDLVTLAWRGDAPRWTRATQVELAIGSMIDRDRSRAYFAIAPVWSLVDGRGRWSANFAFGPAVVAGPTLNGRKIGGNLHFRSALEFGYDAGRLQTTRISLRVAHLSNGGTRGSNPGLDFAGLGIDYRFR